MNWFSHLGLSEEEEKKEDYFCSKLCDTFWDNRDIFFKEAFVTEASSFNSFAPDFSAMRVWLYKTGGLAPTHDFWLQAAFSPLF